mmetsp:Transcript_1487/g.1682  ORF Transcript_1487/g.1682 Transcript_1487/m.1682 type:complete len:81 (+) Transcript_1487:665-907(+)
MMKAKMSALSTREIANLIKKLKELMVASQRRLKKILNAVLLCNSSKSHNSSVHIKHTERGSLACPANKILLGTKKKCKSK